MGELILIASRLATMATDAVATIYTCCINEQPHIYIYEKHTFFGVEYNISNGERNLKTEAAENKYLL